MIGDLRYCSDVLDVCRFDWSHVLGFATVLGVLGDIHVFGEVELPASESIELTLLRLQALLRIHLWSTLSRCPNRPIDHYFYQ